MATRLLLNGTEFQVNVDDGGGNGLLGDQVAPDATALTDGRFTIGYQSEYNGNPAEQQVIARTLGGDDYTDVYFFAQFQGQPAVAPRLDGSVGYVFTDASADATPNHISYVTVTATGALSAPVTIGNFDGGTGHDNLSDPDIATLSTGRQVVVFERAFNGADHDIFLNVVNAAGNATQFTAGSPEHVANDNNWQANAAVAASGNQALVVFEDGTLGGTATADIRARLFNGGSNTLGAAFTIADHTARLFTPAVATLPDNRYVIVYSNNNDIWGKIFDPVTPGGVFLSDEFQIDAPGSLALNPSVAATADGGFIVTWADYNGANYDVLAHRFDAHGESYGDIFIVNTLTDMTQFHPTIAASGADVVIAWEDFAARPTDGNPTGVRAQLFTTTTFDYDSAGLGDFDGNGRAEILFQNDTGDVAVWQTNGNGAVFAITSLGQRPAGYLIDGTGNFNGTPGDDMLLRSGAQLAIWPTNGIAVQGAIVIGSTSPDYHNAGIGDFTGDGPEDLLFRNDAGQIVTWGVVNNSLAIAPQILGSTAPVYHIVGIDDLTGDDQADILFRHDNGDIALWQVANNQLVNAPKVIGSTSPSYHIVSTGDFDGNGAKDILFRGDNGELVEWLLDSTGGLLMAPTSIGTVAAQYHVDGTGDLNGDGRDDIIFRDANGTVVQWLMNGTSLAAAPAVMGTIAVDYAIAAHHFDVV